jgi:hypothetical protein
MHERRRKDVRRTYWQLIAADAPTVTPLAEVRHLHILQCPNEHFLILNAASKAFSPESIGGSLYCARCDWDWPATQ